METKDRENVAELLRRAAALTIPEAQFWTEFNSVGERVKEPIMQVASDAAAAYWDKCRGKKVFFVIASRPSTSELRQGRDELKLIAAVLETGWQLPVLTDQISQD